jgi:glucan phosphoethanolaminetransferase (alkaline phosphatase superfamily)
MECLMSINAKIYLKTLLLLWFTAIIFRFIFLIWQWDLISTHSAKDIATAFYIGLRFDGRISAFASVPLMIFLFIPFLGRLFGKIKIVMLALYTLIFFVIFFLYVGDFANYAYLQQRSTFETLEQLRDLKESVQMVWQTYPVIRLLLAAFTFSFIMNRILKRIFNKWEPSQMRLAKRGGSFAACFLLLGILIYGQYTITYYPLRWSQAYFSGYYELAALALNPIQNLYDTKPADNKVTYDESATRAGYTLVADYLKVSHPDAEANPMRYDRFVTGDGTKDYNVVMIVLESLSTHKSVFMFEELESTPFLKELSEKGLYFPNYYASARTTARSMFSIVTGIPDVTESYSSSSRDPGLVDQQVIWNQFQGYTKLFSLGGSANWANLRGILTNNVPGLSIYE